MAPALNLLVGLLAVRVTKVRLLLVGLPVVRLLAVLLATKLLQTPVKLPVVRVTMVVKTPVVHLLEARQLPVNPSRRELGSNFP